MQQDRVQKKKEKRKKKWMTKPHKGAQPMLKSLWKTPFLYDVFFYIFTHNSSQDDEMFSGN